MAVINHPNPPRNAHGGVWLDGDGNVDWDAYAHEGSENGVDEIHCYLCGRRGVRGFVLNRWGKWVGHWRCTNENACAFRIYRAHRAD